MRQRVGDSGAPRCGAASVSEVCRRCVGGVSEASRRCLGGVSEVSRRCLGCVSEACLGGVSEVSQKCLGGVSAPRLDRRRIDRLREVERAGGRRARRGGERGLRLGGSGEGRLLARANPQHAPPSVGGVQVPEAARGEALLAAEGAAGHLISGDLG